MLGLIGLKNMRNLTTINETGNSSIKDEDFQKSYKTPNLTTNTNSTGA